MDTDIEAVAKVRDQACAYELRHALERLNHWIKGTTQDRAAFIDALGDWVRETHERANALDGTA